MTAGPINVFWKSLTPDFADAHSLPATFATPEGAWTYGAVSDILRTDVAVQIVIEAEALQGKIGICLVSEDCSKLVSPQNLITPDMGKATVSLSFKPDKSPARILVRNYGDDGNKGQARIDKAEIQSAD
jgi:hypothetical protein